MRVKNNINSDVAAGKLIQIEFNLNKDKPFNELKTVQYISVNNDNSATIKVLRSGNVLTTKKNTYFKGDDFGKYGLFLFSASKEKGEIVLQQTFPIYNKA